MSMVSAHLGRRVVQPHAVPDDTAVSTLADLRRGTTARIVGICETADPATCRRLFDLGFAPGTEVEMLRRAPMADPVVFRIAGYEIALRREQACCIRVSADQ